MWQFWKRCQSWEHRHTFANQEHPVLSVSFKHLQISSCTWQYCLHRSDICCFWWILSCFSVLWRVVFSLKLTDVNAAVEDCCFLKIMPQWWIRHWITTLYVWNRHHKPLNPALISLYTKTMLLAPVFKSISQAQSVLKLSDVPKVPSLGHIK